LRTFDAAVARAKPAIRTVLTGNRGSILNHMLHSGQLTYGATIVRILEEGLWETAMTEEITQLQARARAQGDNDDFAWIDRSRILAVALQQGWITPTQIHVGRAIARHYGV
ncbi:MAG: hypothetical protein HY543_07620, partial [Deltaproteobacteria bacterium]|nr:hypothetical protein [Deltaproteobacteria bacterium]